MFATLAAIRKQDFPGKKKIIILKQLETILEIQNKSLASEFHTQKP